LPSISKKLNGASERYSFTHDLEHGMKNTGTMAQDTMEIRGTQEQAGRVYRGITASESREGRFFREESIVLLHTETNKKVFLT
jgi:hypothetical protein